MTYTRLFCYNVRMYIEFVIADNFVLTYLAGACATRMCHNRPCVARLVVGATIGTAVALFYPFFPNVLAITLAIKCLLWVVLCVIMFYKTPHAFVAGLLFLGCTLAFGGGCYAVAVAVSRNANASNFIGKYPMFLLPIGAGAVYAGARYCMRRTKVIRARAPYEYGVEVSVYGVAVNFSAFLDTGNCVFDDMIGLPVIITDMQVFANKLDGIGTVRFVKNLPSLRKISAKTPAGTVEIRILEPTRVTVYSDRHGHKINAMVGLVCGNTGLFSGTHEMLLGPAAIAGSDYDF